jgi:hypothetical protein
VIAAAFLLSGGPDETARASHDGGMDLMAIDLDPFATPANDATSLGSTETCARIDENNVLDVDEDFLDGLRVDVTASNIPASTAMIGFAYTLGYSEANLTVAAADLNFLLVQDPNSSPFNGSEPPRHGWQQLLSASAADIGSGEPEWHRRAPPRVHPLRRHRGCRRLHSHFVWWRSYRREQHSAPCRSVERWQHSGQYALPGGHRASRPAGDSGDGYLAGGCADGLSFTVTGNAVVHNAARLGPSTAT